MENSNTELLYSCIFAGIGLLLIFGTKKEWTIFVDPPEEWAAYYSHSALKKLFGKESLPGINYFAGAVFILLGAFSALVTLFK